MEAALSILQYRPNNKQFIIKQILFFEQILYDISYRKLTLVKNKKNTKTTKQKQTNKQKNKQTKNKQTKNKQTKNKQTNKQKTGKQKYKNTNVQINI